MYDRYAPDDAQEISDGFFYRPYGDDDELHMPPSKPCPPPYSDPVCYPEPPPEPIKKSGFSLPGFLGNIDTEVLILILLMLLVMSRDGFDSIEMLIGIGVLLFAGMN